MGFFLGSLLSSQLSARSIFDSNANLYTTYTANGAFMVSKKENKTTKVAWFELLSILKGCAVRMYNLHSFPLSIWTRLLQFSSLKYMSSLMNSIFSLFQTSLQATAGKKILFKLGKNPVHQNWYCFKLENFKNQVQIDRGPVYHITANLSRSGW